MIDIEFLFLIVIIFEYIVMKIEEKNYYLIGFFNLINGLFIVQYYEEIHIIFAIFGLLFILLKSAFQLFALREYFNKE